MKKALTYLVVVAIAFSSVGCKKILEAARKKGDASAPVATSSTNDPDDQLQEKIDEYVTCINTLSSNIHRSRSRYFDWAPRGPLTGKERWAYGLYEIHSTAECRAAAAKGASLPPKDPKLEAAGTDFAVKAAVLEPLIKQAYVYYEQKNYKDDAWAKGKALHAQLVPAFDAFDKADDLLHDTVEAITRPLATRMLAKIEKEDGRKFYYYRKNALIQARDVIDTAFPSRNDDHVDFPKYQLAYAGLEKALGDLKDYGSAHKADLEKSGAGKPPNWPVAASHYDSFVRALEDFQKKAKGLLRCLRDAPAKAKAKDGKVNLDALSRCDDGAPKDVLKEYNDFIHTSNSNLFP